MTLSGPTLAAKVDQFFAAADTDTRHPPGLRILDAANYTGANPFFIEGLIRSRELPAIKLGSRWIILREDLDAYLDRKRERK